MKLGEYEVKVTGKDSVEIGRVKVSREQINSILAEMDEWKPTPEFKVGDYVRVKDDADVWQTELRGEYGRVVEAPEYRFGIVLAIPIELARKLNGAGNLGGKVKKGHGWYMRPKTLELVD